MGQCLAAGWTEQQFWKSSLRAVYNLIYTVQQREKEIRQERWRQTQLICDFVYFQYRKQGWSKHSFELPFAQDEVKKKEVKVLTPEEKEKLFGKADRKIKEKLNGTR